MVGWPEYFVNQPCQSPPIAIHQTKGNEKKRKEEKKKKRCRNLPEEWGSRRVMIWGVREMILALGSQKSAPHGRGEEEMGFGTLKTRAVYI